MSADLIPFTITRSKWARGGCISWLLDAETGKQCCLGQFAERICHIPAEQLRDRSAFLEIPDLLPENVRVWSLDWDCSNSALAAEMMARNDDMQITDAERERMLTAMFAEVGYAVTFED